MSQATSAPGVTTRIAGFLNDKCFLGAFNVLDQETVGPQVGRDLQKKAILAVILSTLQEAITRSARPCLRSGTPTAAASLP